MHIYTKLSAIAIAVTALTGCLPDKKVDEVKALIYDDIDATNTLGNALDTRKMCQTTQWESTKDERKRDVVVYSCELTGYEVYFNGATDKYIQHVSSENQSKLSEAKRQYELAEETAKEDKAYFDMIETLKNKHVFTAFAALKKEARNIRMIIEFTAGDNRDVRIAKYQISPEVLNAYNDAAKVFMNIMDNSELYSRIMVGRYQGVFENIIDDINNGFSEEEAIKNSTQHYRNDDELTNLKKRYDEATLLTSASGLEKLRSQIVGNQPIKVVHKLTYATAGISPVLLGCTYEFYTPNSKGNVAYRKALDNSVQCLKESYMTEYDNFYITMFNTIYREQLKRK